MPYPVARLQRRTRRSGANVTAARPAVRRVDRGQRRPGRPGARGKRSGSVEAARLAISLRPLARLDQEQEPAASGGETGSGRGLEQEEVEVTNDRPWRLVDLSFAPSGNGRERATINGVEVVRENGRYWITTPNGPIWSNIDERGVDPALNYLFEKRKQEQQSSQ
jgi:hypothetical protein